MILEIADLSKMLEVPMSKKLLTTQEAADVIGVSAAVFRRIAADLEAKPDGYYIAHKKRCPKWSLVWSARNTVTNKRGCGPYLARPQADSHCYVIFGGHH